jgi:hypothetical protein
VILDLRRGPPAQVRVLETEHARHLVVEIASRHIDAPGIGEQVGGGDDDIGSITVVEERDPGAVGREHDLRQVVRHGRAGCGGEPGQ